MHSINNGKVTILTIGRFHVFEYARIFEGFGILNKIISGYPKFKLRDENNIPRKKIIGMGTHSFYMFLVGKKFLPDQFKQILDNFSVLVFQIFSVPFILIHRSEYLFILSKSGLISALIQKYILKGKVIIEHTSTFPENYNNVSKKESYFYGVRPQIIDKFSKLIHILEFNIADKIILPTNYVKETFIKYANKLEKKISIIPIPINNRFRTYLDKYNKNFKSNNAFINTKNELKILSISQVTPRKGIKYLFEGLNYLSKKYDVKLTLIGNASSEMEKYLKSYKKDFDINWIKKINHEKIVEYYKKSNLFILLSTEEGLPSVFKECLISGLPIIGSKESGAEDLVSIGNCYCINKESKSDLLITIENIINNQNSLKTFLDDKEINKFNLDIIKRWEKLLLRNDFTIND